MDYIFYFIITIAILVFVHEFGHFAAAKLSKMRVDVFAIGFGQRLFGYNKLTGFTTGSLPKDFDGQGNTDYRLSLLPLGGYVKIAGMVDESFDTEYKNREPQPYEFRSRPTYQKLFVISAGVLMNLLLTLIVFWGINFSQGKQVYNTTSVGTISEQSLAADAGFQSGDEIISIDGTKVNHWEEVMNNLLLTNVGKEKEVVVMRNGEEVKFAVPASVITDAQQEGMFLPIGNTEPYISEVMKNSPAEESGIEAGDIFLEIDNHKINESQDVIDIVSSNREKDIPVVLLRNEDTVRTMVNPGIEGKIGVAIASMYAGPVHKQKYSFGESVEKSFTDIGQITALTFAMGKNIITGEMEFSSAFGGPVKIAQFAATSAERGMMSFLYFLAMLSLSLAIINILPFPALDGGHFVIIAIEGIMRRELPLKFKIAIQNAGFVLLLALMAFIIYSDIVSL